MRYALDTHEFLGEARKTCKTCAFSGSSFYHDPCNSCNSSPTPIGWQPKSEASASTPKTPEQQKQEQGTRFDAGKPRYDLLPPDALDELVRVYNVGLDKYGVRNWEKGMDWGRVVGSLLRHSFAWMSGQDRDPESGLHHMAHVAWNALTLVAYAKRELGTDDRAKAGGEG